MARALTVSMLMVGAVAVHASAAAAHRVTPVNPQASPDTVKTVADGARAEQFACHDGANQLWRGSDRGGLIAEHSGKCLQPVSTAEGAVVQQFTCDDQNDEQVWQLILINGTNYLYNIVSLSTGMCLTVQDASEADGATVHMLPCHYTTDGQIWVNTKAPPPPPAD